MACKRNPALPMNEIAMLFTGLIRKEEIQEKFEYSLSLMGTAMGVDRTNICELSDDRKVVVNSYEWCASGVPSIKSSLVGIQPDKYPSITPKLKEMSVIAVSTPEDWPPESEKFQEWFEAVGTKSILIVPLVYSSERTIGVWFFETVKETRSWDSADIRMINFVGTTIANVIHRVNVERRNMQMEKAFKLSPIGKEIYDSRGKLLEVNDSCLNIFGVVDVKEIRGFDLFDDPNVTAEFKRMLLAGLSIRYEAEFDFEKVKEFKLYRTWKSDKIWVSVDISVIPGEGYLVQVQDISQKVETELMLRERTRQLEKSLKEQNALYRISKVLESAGGMGEICERVVNIIPSAWDVGNDVQVEIILRGKIFSSGEFGADGSILESEIRVHKGRVGYLRIWKPRTDDFMDGEKVLADSVAERIGSTAEKYDIQERSQEAEKMEMLGRIAGGVAHDFNNVLAGIIGSAELLECTGVEAEHVHDVVRTAIRGSNTVKQLMAFARSSEIEHVRFDLQQTVLSAVGIMKHFVDRKVSVVSDMQLARAHIRGNETLVENAIINVAVNGCQSMLQKEGGQLILRSSYDEENGMVRINIIDEGEGIPDDVVCHIFEPFFSTKPPGQGTGLGLSAVYGTMKSHGGYVTVESHSGIGSRFSLFFPADQSDLSNVLVSVRSNDDIDVSDSGSEQLGSYSGESPSYVGKCVLLVDDEEVIRKVGIQHLSKLGFSVLSAENGSAAIDIFKDHWNEIDLVIMDLCMPVMSGLDAFHKMKLIDPNVRVLVSSGYHDDENVRSMISAGALGELEKPFTRRKLTERLSVIFGRHLRC